MADKKETQIIEDLVLIARRVPPGDRWRLVSEEPDGTIHTTLTDSLEAYMRKSGFKGDYKLAFVHEAATGRAKFGTDAVQYATHVLSWAPTNSLDTFKVSVDSIESRKSSIIKKYAGQIDLQVNWKSSSISNHKGYNMYDYKLFEEFCA